MHLSISVSNSWCLVQSVALLPNSVFFIFKEGGEHNEMNQQIIIKS